MSASKLRLRAYRQTDFEDLFNLDKSCFARPFRFSRADMRRYVSTAHARVIVAEFDDQLAGFCIVHLQKAGVELVGYLTTIDVHPAVRGLGVARELVKAAELHVQQAGGTEMLLHVFTGNDPAIRLYTRQGYRLRRTQHDFYGPELHAFVYSKALAG